MSTTEAPAELSATASLPSLGASQLLTPHANSPSPSSPTLGRPFRVVLTGGPGGGKTTAGDILRREFGKAVAFVPEAATMLFSGGFPRYDDPRCVPYQQQAIYHVQVNLEDTQMAHYSDRAVLLCDRGTADGAAYIASTEQWCAQLNTTMEKELARYDAVIFFQSAAVRSHQINGTMLEGGNAARTESQHEAQTLDSRLYEVWHRHPQFHLVESRDSFFDKIQESVMLFRRIVKELKQRSELDRLV